MRQVAVIYTSTGPLVKNFGDVLRGALPGCGIISIADDSLIRDVMVRGGVDDNLRARTFLYVESAVEAGADLVVVACSSIGALAAEADARFPVPVLRIDGPMMEAALGYGDRIGVLASVDTTMGPSTDLLRQTAAAHGREVEIFDRVATGAYEAQSAGDPALHDRLLEQAADALAQQVDVIALAQGSMARLEAPLAARTGKPVLSSPALCAERVARLLAEMEASA